MDRTGVACRGYCFFDIPLERTSSSYPLHKDDKPFAEIWIVNFKDWWPSLKCFNYDTWQIVGVLIHEMIHAALCLCMCRCEYHRRRWEHGKESDHDIHFAGIACAIQDSSWWSYGKWMDTHYRQSLATDIQKGLNFPTDVELRMIDSNCHHMRKMIETRRALEPRTAPTRAMYNRCIGDCWTVDSWRSSWGDAW